MHYFNCLLYLENQCRGSGLHMP
ncbi:hypothetical protein Zm00014a_007213 [Zea mays]|uniref:Uncharacterized protein n=1 Tax=Zea mays TaxID=4577 RepID=A0A3L6E7D3_MAIZE|nr:hypothetical protein Zm00014a_007213 [Zea mays]